MDHAPGRGCDDIHVNEYIAFSQRGHGAHQGGCSTVSEWRLCRDGTAANIDSFHLRVHDRGPGRKVLGTAGAATVIGEGAMMLITDRKTVRALIVGPDVIVRLGLRTLLQAGGQISIVADVEPAWDAIGQLGQLCLDVAVLHGALTGPAGAPLLSELRTLARYVPVLVLTDECSSAAVEQALRCGATGYLVTGQYAPDELLAAVLATANGQPRLSPDVVGILVNRLRVPQLAAEPPRPTRLSQREREIVENLVRGRTNAEIGELLGISEKTVKNHVNHVYAKLHTRNRAETVARWLGPESPSGR